MSSIFNRLIKFGSCRLLFKIKEVEEEILERVARHKIFNAGKWDIGQTYLDRQMAKFMGVVLLMMARNATGGHKS